MIDEPPTTRQQPVTDPPAGRRPRRRLLTPYSAMVLAAVTCAAGFYGGVRVEKGQVASTPRTLSAAALGGGAGAATGRSATAGGGASGARSSGARAGFAGRAGFDGAAGGGTLGTVASVNGRTLVLTEATGNTVKVTLNSATKISKMQSVGRGSVHPGDTIIVAGAASKRGNVSATSITDSGDAAAGSGSSGGSGSRGSSGSSGGAGSGGGAIGSLFSGGG